jgi:hypothetical protein
MQVITRDLPMLVLDGWSHATTDSSIMRVTGTETMAVLNTITSGTMTTIGTRIGSTTTTARFIHHSKVPLSAIRDIHKGNFRV